MSYAPQHLKDLMAYYVSKGGVNAGIVGSWKTHGRGYHLGRDRIFSTCAYKPDGVCKPGLYWNDYSVKTLRDKNGLSNAASGVDLGRINGALIPMYNFSAWLAARCMAKDPDTKDIREVIYWDRARKVVVGWSALAPDRLIDNYGDGTHQWHTHISYFRDAEGRDQTAIFKRYFDPEEDTVNSYPVPTKPSDGYVAKGKVLYTSDAKVSTDPQRIIIDPGRRMPYLGKPDANTVIVAYVNASGVNTGKSYFMHAADLTDIKPIPEKDCPPCPPTDCTDEVNAAVAAAVQPLNARIALLEAALAKAQAALNIANDAKTALKAWLAS